jgi:hypothetical protein
MGTFESRIFSLACPAIAFPLGYVLESITQQDPLRTEADPTPCGVPGLGYYIPRRVDDKLRSAIHFDMGFFLAYRRPGPDA